MERLLWDGPPLRPPLRWVPAFGDVNRLTRDLVVSKLEDADAEVRRTLVVADRDLRNPEIISTSDFPELERRRRRIIASPLAEVLDADEALAGLGELENSVDVVHVVGDVGIATRVLEVSQEHRPDGRLMHAAQTACSGPRPSMRSRRRGFTNP
jgi:hypothetical protein